MDTNIGILEPEIIPDRRGASIEAAAAAVGPTATAAQVRAMARAVYGIDATDAEIRRALEGRRAR